jgi:hypothetical protein
MKLLILCNGAARHGIMNKKSSKLYDARMVRMSIREIGSGHTETKAPHPRKCVPPLKKITAFRSYFNME